MYLDDIQIAGNPLPEPNLTYDWPFGWDSPIVPSSITGTYTISQLWGGEPTFIDCAIINNGDGDANSFHVGLYLDDSLIYEWPSFGLSFWDWEQDIDYKTIIKTGLHERKMIVDNRNEVQESDENDNTYWQYFYWNPPEITYTGYVKFWDKNPPATQKSAKDILIELRDTDGMNSELLASGRTSQNGYFILGPVPNNNDTQDKDGVQPDIFLRILADNDACYVINTGTYTWQHTTQTVYNHPSGTYDTLIDIPQDTSEAFYVADVIREGKEKWQQLGLSDPGKLCCVVGYGVDTYYLYDGETLYVDNSHIISEGTPDTYDNGTIQHEYGHYLSDRFDFFDSLPQSGSPHLWQDTLPVDRASAEAFAHLWSSFVRNDIYKRNYFDNFSQYVWVNLENGEHGHYNGFTNYTLGSANNYGTPCEGAVAGMLWDIYDSNNDDYSWWTGTPGIGYQDGIIDSLSLPIDTILDVLLNRTVNGHHPDNIDEFWQAWFQDPSKGYCDAMEDIWYEHGDSVSCHCCQNRGNVDGVIGGAGPVDLSDLTYLVAYLYQGGYPPSCAEEGDVDGIAVGGVAINSSDLTYLVAFLFQGGPPPPSC